MAELLTITEKTRQKIRKMILSGSYKLNHNLPQRKIADELGVSPIVVRESLRMLEKDGVVEIVPKWGARVTTFGPEKVQGMSFVREALEGMAARLLAERITESEITLLRNLADEVNALFDDMTVEHKQLAEVHYSFHTRITQLAGCEELSQALERINLQYLLWLNSEIVSPMLLSQTPGCHRKLVEVIAQKDPDKAEQFMRHHVQKGFQDIMNSLKEKNGHTEKTGL